MSSRWAVPLVLLVASAAVVGCGDRDRERPAPRAEVHRVAPVDASRPTAPAGPTLVKLERLDGRFGRHDTVIVARSGAATVQLAHGGGGFRKQVCRLDAAAVRSLRHDLRRLPIDGRERRVPGYPAHADDGVIIARPPVYTVTYRGRFQLFGGATMPTDGAPLAAHVERILTAHEGRCRTIFQRP